MKFLFCLLIASFLHAYEQPPLFISLGAHCSPSVIISEFGCRTEAYPFDWIRCHLHDRFAQIFETDFEFFLDTTCFKKHPISPKIIYHERYGLEFMHEWQKYDFWADLMQYEIDFPEVFDKFDRRIKRFKELKNLENRKVVFLRMVYELESDPRADFIPKSQQVIRERQGLALVRGLKKMFPKMDFTVVIINFIENKTKPFTPRKELIEFKVPRNYKLRDFEAIFKHFWPEFTPPLNPQWGQ